jgi:putative monooxygenase ydhR
MAFALVNNVRIENVDQSREALQSQVVANMKKAPGFVSGVWAADRDKGRGVGIVVFESREQAEAVLKRLESGELKRPPGVTVESVAVYEVQAQA